ncbi:MAG TPA: hypothetical protein VHL77_09915 [Ferruginibacter sp.]|nr:hypothetical protein [Ferruginibacter sp.]
MTRSGKSVFYFGLYLVLTGAFIFFAPTDFVSIFKLPEVPPAWARILGIIVAILGAYYVVAGRNSLKPFIRATIYLRLFFLVSLIILVLAGELEKAFLPFGIIDMLGAIWTALALKAGQ